MCGFKVSKPPACLPKLREATYEVVFNMKLHETLKLCGSVRLGIGVGAMVLCQ